MNRAGITKEYAKEVFLDAIGPNFINSLNALDCTFNVRVLSNFLIVPSVETGDPALKIKIDPESLIDDKTEETIGYRYYVTISISTDEMSFDPGEGTLDAVKRFDRWSRISGQMYILNNLEFYFEDYFG